jgi:hypothetical protein
MPARNPNIIPDGTYSVGDEIKPGVYRVGRYWARLDRTQHTIANDFESGCPSIVVVQPTDAYVKITGEAIAADLSTIDPIATGCSSGTFLVGRDIAPGRYRIRSSGLSYWARLDQGLDVIANENGKGQRILIVQPSDFAVKLSRVEAIERI